MKDLLECINCVAKGLVDNPDEVVVGIEEGEECAVLLHVAPEDLGKVIGKSGRTADALRTILAAAARKHGTTCRLEIMES
ncbi:MAG: KH domain-containing protein [Proteobacteria bacterium]|nr:KH domain-containing protein [Pseudomonadota bacterium]